VLKVTVHPLPFVNIRINVCMGVSIWKFKLVQPIFSWISIWASLKTCIYVYTESDIVGGWVSRWVSERVSEWVSKCVNEGVREWVNKFMSDWVWVWIHYYLRLCIIYLNIEIIILVLNNTPTDNINNVTSIVFTYH